MESMTAPQPLTMEGPSCDGSPTPRRLGPLWFFDPGAGLRRRGNYEKSQTAARAGGGWLRRPARLAGTTGSRSPRRRATRASRAEQIDPRPEDHVETAGAQVRTRSDLRAARQRSGRLPPRGPPHGSPLFGYPSGARLRSPRVAVWSPPTARPACATASRGAPRKGIGMGRRGASAPYAALGVRGSWWR